MSLLRHCWGWLVGRDRDSGAWRGLLSAGARWRAEPIQGIDSDWAGWWSLCRRDANCDSGRDNLCGWRNEARIQSIVGRWWRQWRCRYLRRRRDDGRREVGLDRWRECAAHCSGRRWRSRCQKFASIELRGTIGKDLTIGGIPTDIHLRTPRRRQPCGRDKEEERNQEGESGWMRSFHTTRGRTLERGRSA